MNLFQIMRTYLAVVERGTFAKAAHALKLSNATVSTQITTLEAHVGVTLLIRSTRKLTLTSEGQEYYELCKRVLNDIAESEATLGRGRSSPQGRVRIDMNSYFAHHLVLPRLPEYLACHAGVNLEFTDSGHLFGAEQIGCDVMLRMRLSAPEDSGLVARELGHSRVVFAASPDYLARYGEPLTPDELRKHNCIQFIEPLTGRRWEWGFERGGKKFTYEFAGQIAASDTEMRTTAAIRGMGIILGLFCNLCPAVERGKLRLILQDWSWQAPPMYLFYPQGRQRSAAVKSFVDFMVASFPPGREVLPTKCATPLVVD